MTRGQTRDPVTIIADARANTLIVGASPHDMRLAESLIQQLDEAEAKAGTALKSFTLEKADATQVANTLQTLYRYYHLFSYPELENLVKRAGFLILKSFPESSYRCPIKFFSRNICLLVKKPAYN